MRQLILIRHAKARPEPPAGGGDFDRRLSARGLRQLAELPRMLAGCTDPAGRILASPAQRTRQTAEGLAGRLQGWPRVIEWRPELYLAREAELLRVIAAQPDSLTVLCIVGHNPGLAALAGSLAGRAVSMPTLGAVALGAGGDGWRDFQHAGTRLLWQAVPGC